MSRRIIITLTLSTLLLLCSNAIAQPGSKHFGKVWIQGESLLYTTKFDSGTAPVNQIAFLPQAMPPYLTSGNSNICDSLGNLLLISDGFSLYDKNLNFIDNGQMLVPNLIYNLEDGFSDYVQTSIILPFANGKYRLITPTVSDDSCDYNWLQAGNGALFDLLLYDEVDMNANGGAGTVTKRMVPLLQNVRLSKTQMMACRHGDGKSWWLLKQASDTNLVYKFLFTEDKIYGPYIQGFSGAAARFGNWDLAGQAMFSKDGTKYATGIQSSGKVFVADFDRCSGLLSNPKVYKVPARLTGNPSSPAEKDSSISGLAFSPNGRYLYVSGFFNVQQFDLQHTASPLAWTLLSGPDTTLQEFQQYLNIYPGPDGKLYIGNWGGFAGQMSVINTPDSSGSAAGFCRKCLRFPGFLYDSVIRFAAVSIPPCMPDYSLGPTSPICYPAGVNASALEKPVFTLYPNPSPGTITVKSNTAGTLYLYDATGKTTGTFTLNATGSSFSIDVGNLPAGFYQYRFTSRNGLSTTDKLVIKQ